MGYQFKLEALRQFRNFQEDIQQKELAQAQQLRDQEMERLESLLDKRKAVEQSLRTEQQNSINGPHMALFDTYLQRISNDIAAQRQKLEDAEALCREKMGALVKAMQQRKTIEKLKEKDFDAYIENMNQNEQKFLNEIAINKFSRDQM